MMSGLAARQSVVLLRTWLRCVQMIEWNLDSRNSPLSAYKDGSAKPRSAKELPQHRELTTEELLTRTAAFESSKNFVSDMNRVVYTDRLVSINYA